MDVKTKYKVNDMIYMLHNSVIKQAQIKKFRVEVNTHSKVDVVYYVVIVGGSTSGIDVSEQRVFTTKIEVAYTWLDTQDLEAREVIQGFLARA